MAAQNREFNQNDIIECMTPQESVSYVKLPIHLIKWQPYLNPIQNTVITYLVSRIHKKYGYAFPSTKTASDDCNICENTFTKTIRFLEQIKLIYVDRTNKSNRYYLQSPTEPTQEILNKYIPKMIEKYNGRQTDDKKSSKKKLIIFKSSKTNASNSLNEIIDQASIKSSPQQMRSKQNLQNSNLSKQQQPKTNSHTCSNKLEQNLNKDNSAVDVDFSKVNILKQQGISSQTSIQLTQALNPNIDLDQFIKYILYDVGKSMDIKNKPGFIIHGIRNLQNDFLEKTAEKVDAKNLKVDVDLKSKFQQIKDGIESIALKRWLSMDKVEKDQVIAETHESTNFIQGYKYSQETLDLLYIDTVKQKYLGFTEEENKILDKGDHEITESELTKISDKLKKLS